MNIEWLAVEKIVAGMIQALLSGAVVAPVGWLVLGGNTGVSLRNIPEFLVVLLLVALLSASSGLALGCSVGQTHIGLLFSLVLTPIIMFGCTYYPWSALASFPIIQKLVLVNPLVYASEGLRATMTPHIPHMATWVVVSVLALLDVLLIAVGLNRFFHKAVS
jgi:ABC-2 type transport system permease protein